MAFSWNGDTRVARALLLCGGFQCVTSVISATALSMTVLIMEPSPVSFLSSSFDLIAAEPHARA
jgi:hypothetical protein